LPILFCRGVGGGAIPTTPEPAWPSLPELVPINRGGRTRTRTGEEPALLPAEAREVTTDPDMATAGEARDPEADGTLEASAANSGTAGGPGGGPGLRGKHRLLPAIDQERLQSLTNYLLLF
jgi:hypothetical protein